MGHSAEIQLYQGKDGWVWEFQTGNERTLARCDRPFPSYKQAKQSAQRFRAYLRERAWIRSSRHIGGF